MNTIYCIGEILIDFIPTEKGTSLKNAGVFKKIPGGAPANVAVALAKLGSRAAFLGKISKDSFGDFLLEELYAAKVDISKVLRSNIGKTSLAFVSLDAQKNRDFIFYRDNCADELLSPDELDENIFSENDILHFGSLCLQHSPINDTHIKAIKAVKAKGGIVSFDLNIRDSLWEDKNLYRDTVNEFIRYADILKVSDEDLNFMLETTDDDKHTDYIESLKEPKIILNTRGSKSIKVYHKHAWRKYKPFNVTVKDTTGAGDSFIGALLHCLNKNCQPVDNLIDSQIDDWINFSAAASAITVSSYGAMGSMPTAQEVYNFLDNAANFR